MPLPDGWANLRKDQSKAMQSLLRGQKVKLAELTTATMIQVGLAVTARSGIVFDISCFGVDAQDKLSDDRYFIFYNQKTSPDGSLSSIGAGTGDNERFQLDLARLPQTIRKLVFTITSDQEGAMAQIRQGHWRILDRGNEVGKFSFSGADFKAEKAIIAAEIYLKDVWRVAAVGQGFNGGLSTLLKHYGGTEVAASIPLPVAPSSRLVSLEKRIEKEAPQLINLAKTLTVSLEKKKLQDVVARVALVLDASGSMVTQYTRGDIQLVVDKVVPLSIHFDDNGELDTWAFADKSRSLTAVTLQNVKGYIEREWGGWRNWMNALNARINNEPVVMREIVKMYMKSHLPAYVIFISDGGVGYDRDIAKILIEASKYPIFWQFVGLGGSNYGILERFDTMKGRTLDNANFFALDDIRSISNSDLYDRLLNEFPDWLKAAKSKGILK